MERQNCCTVNVKRHIKLPRFSCKNVEILQPITSALVPNSKRNYASECLCRVPLLVKGMYNYLHGTLRLPILAVIVIFLTFPILLGALHSAFCCEQRSPSCSPGVGASCGVPPSCSQALNAVVGIRTGSARMLAKRGAICFWKSKNDVGLNQKGNRLGVVW